MKLDTKKLSRWVATLAFAALTPLAHALPVVNGGFESNDGIGDFAGWTETLTGATFFVGDETFGDKPAHSGSFSAAFRYFATDASLTQALGPLTPGAEYDVAFFLNIVVLDSFAATAGGSNLLSGATVGPVDGDGWALYTNKFTAGGASADLVFAWDGLGATRCTSPSGDCSIYLDDVSVAAAQVPEPGTLLLVGAALAAGAMVRRKKQI